MALIEELHSYNKVYQSTSSSRNVIASNWMNGNNIKVYDDVTSVVEEYHGLSEDAAKAAVASFMSNSMTDYRIRSSSTIPYSWIVCPQAKGTKINSSSRRNGDSRMFTVTITTETHSCSNSAGWEEY